MRRHTALPWPRRGMREQIWQNRLATGFAYVLGLRVALRDFFAITTDAVGDPLAFAQGVPGDRLVVLADLHVVGTMMGAAGAAEGAVTAAVRTQVGDGLQPSRASGAMESVSDVVQSRPMYASHASCMTSQATTGGACANASAMACGESTSARPYDVSPDDSPSDRAKSHTSG